MGDVVQGDYGRWPIPYKTTTQSSLRNVEGDLRERTSVHEIALSVGPRQDNGIVACVESQSNPPAKSLNPSLRWSWRSKGLGTEVSFKDWSSRPPSHLRTMQNLDGRDVPREANQGNKIPGTLIIAKTTPVWLSFMSSSGPNCLDWIAAACARKSSLGISLDRLTVSR